jgi:hypothetical protein
VDVDGGCDGHLPQAERHRSRFAAPAEIMCTCWLAKRRPLCCRFKPGGREEHGSCSFTRQPFASPFACTDSSPVRSTIAATRTVDDYLRSFHSPAIRQR